MNFQHLAAGLNGFSAKPIYESGKVIFCKEIDGNVQPTNKKYNLLSKGL